jgi:glycerol-3-phosphate dehydrogenase
MSEDFYFSVHISFVFKAMHLYCIFIFSGQMDDARMCLSVALTATRHGATVANHVRVTKLLKEKDSSGKLVLRGASLRDEITGKEWDVRAKCIINATGPMTDTIRKMDNPMTKEICCPSSGVHIVLPGYYR